MIVIEKKYENKCLNCGLSFLWYRKGKKYCSNKCIEEFYSHRNINYNRLDDSNLKRIIKTNDNIKCKLCGKDILWKKNRKYCEECLEKKQKESMDKYNLNRKEKEKENKIIKCRICKIEFYSKLKNQYICNDCKSSKKDLPEKIMQRKIVEKERNLKLKELKK